MTGQIVLAFTPSPDIKQWLCRSDGYGNWWFEQFVSFYDTGCKQYVASCPEHSRRVGHEPYFDLAKGGIVEPPRVYITHCPTGAERKPFKTIDDVKASPLSREKPE